MGLVRPILAKLSIQYMNDFFASGTGHLSANNKNSALIDHMVKIGNSECDFVFDDVKILDTGSYDEQIRFIYTYKSKMCVCLCGA